MKYVFISRMFSGMFESIKEQQWKPAGIPTFTKLIETLASTKELIWFIVCRTKEESAVVNDEYRQIVFNNIRLIIIPYKYILNSGKVNASFTTICALYYIIKKIKNFQNTLFYTDRSNIAIAGVIKVMFAAPVVVRILGVYPDQKKLATSTSHKLFSLVTYISYKINYNLFVCTQDGSGAEFYLDRLLGRNAKKTILLNGIDWNLKVTPPMKKPEKIILLYVGKIIMDKGILELIESFSRVAKSERNVILKIIGKGCLFDKVKRIIADRGLENSIQLIGSVSLHKVKEYYLSSDVYISLNKLGNLSNTVLEAMASGKCIIMLGRNKETHADEETERLVPDDIVIRLDPKNVVEELSGKIVDLAHNPESIKTYSNKMRAFAKQFLWTWDDRVNYEIELLEKVARGEPVYDGAYLKGFKA